MMKLKTLRNCYMSDGRNYEQKLKEEAIEWIKHYKNMLSKDPSDLVNHIGITMTCHFIKDFFNITDEDLKGE